METCPDCGSADLSHTAALTTVFTRCNDCGNEWSDTS